METPLLKVSKPMFFKKKLCDLSFFGGIPTLINLFYVVGGPRGEFGFQYPIFILTIMLNVIFIILCLSIL